MKLVLASTSAQRKILMEKFGIPFEVVPSEYDEIMDESIPPSELAIQLSLGKAQTVAKRYDDSLVIGADTFAYSDNKYFGKPKNKEDAMKMIKTLTLKPHVLITGYTLINTKTNETFSDYSEAKVTMRQISDKEIEEYIEHTKPFDKAGGYSIEGQAGLFIEKIEGDLYAILGLPISKIASTFKEQGIEYHL